MRFVRFVRFPFASLRLAFCASCVLGICVLCVLRLASLRLERLGGAFWSFASASCVLRLANHSKVYTPASIEPTPFMYTCYVE